MLTFWSQIETQGLWKKWWQGSSVAMSSLIYSLQQIGQHCSWPIAERNERCSLPIISSLTETDFLKESNKNSENGKRVSVKAKLSICCFCRKTDFFANCLTTVFYYIKVCLQKLIKLSLRILAPGFYLLTDPCKLTLVILLLPVWSSRTRVSGSPSMLSLLAGGLATSTSTARDSKCARAVWKRRHTTLLENSSFKIIIFF